MKKKKKNQALNNTKEIRLKKMAKFKINKNCMKRICVKNYNYMKAINED